VSAYHGEQTFLLTIDCESIPIRTPIVGRHFVSNCLAAAAVTRVLGVELPTIARGIENVRRIPARMENVCRGQDFPFYLDTATTPEALACVLNSLRSITPGKLICVLGLAADDERSERPRFGRTLERMADVGIITAGHYESKLPLNVAHDILDGYDRPAIAHLIPDRARAIVWAVAQARPGDTVYVLGQNDKDGETMPVASFCDRDRDLAELEIVKQSRPVVMRFAA
jgi:UDP-N-acetylmuramoyl-L-alanyl-D-glutamate--2,6-diaminopimelate ligase